MAQKKAAQTKKAAPSIASKKASQKSTAKKSAGQKVLSQKGLGYKAPAQKATAKQPTKKAALGQKAAKVASTQKAGQLKPQAKPKPVSKASTIKTLASKSPANKMPGNKMVATKPAAAATSNRDLGRKGQSREEPVPRPKPAKVSSRYGVGDKVVHPQHGAATIAKRVKREFGGEVRDYYVLDISTESLTVMVPIDKIDAVVRSVISKAQSRNVLNSLKDEAQEAGANWSRWYKVLTEKMYSGDIFQVAEVVRDLSFAQQTKGISPALKRMLSKARMTLISELSFSLEVDEEEATRRLDKAVPKIENPLVPAL